MLPDPAKIYRGIETLTACGRTAAEMGLVDGFSGNLSVRIASDLALITGRGTVKGHLSPEDVALAQLDGKAAGKSPSSESGMHLAIYQNFPNCAAIAHTHPGALQTLELRQAVLSWEELPLFEAALWKGRMLGLGRFAPGSAELGATCAQAMKEAWNERLPLPCGVWLAGHGLVACGETLLDCIAFCGEIEHLARIRLQTPNPPLPASAR